jgi:hypothetical protein
MLVANGVLAALSGFETIGIAPIMRTIPYVGIDDTNVNHCLELSRLCARG